MHPVSSAIDSQFRADLHCHTVFSDGSCTPEEIIDLAIHTGLSALSITDHDTIDAYTRALPYAKQKGLLLGTGVEFSCVYKQHNVHILGYDFLLQNEKLQQFCLVQREHRRERNHAILKKLERLCMPIAEEELLAMQNSHRTLGRPHIAELMVKKGYVKTFQEAFSYYIGDGKCCYEQGKSVSVEEGIAVIHEAKGKAFIAHPHLFSDGTIVKQLLMLGFDGLECRYAKCSPEKERRWLKMAKEKNLLMSGGSDFHGEMKPHIPLGCSWVTKEVFDQIFVNSISL